MNEARVSDYFNFFGFMRGSRLHPLWGLASYYLLDCGSGINFYSDILKMNQPKILEKEITYSIRSLLRQFGIFHYKNHGGLGSAPGLPDITGVLKDGRGFWIEVKTERGKLSPHQERFIQNINASGGLAFVARSIDDVIEKLDLQKHLLIHGG